MSEDIEDEYAAAQTVVDEVEEVSVVENPATEMEPAAPKLQDPEENKELADALRKNKTIDWQKRDSARAKMRMLIKKLLKKHKYPPEGMDDAAQTVMLQCELWTDNNDMMEERVSNYASRLSEYVSEINK